MKLLSFQPCSLYQNGGCARVLRRIYEGREKDVVSVYISNTTSIPKNGKIAEKAVYSYPLKKKWMRWKVRDLASFLRDHVFFEKNKRKLQREVQKKTYDILHIVNHGPFSNSLNDPKFFSGKELWVSFHDHFSLCSSFEDTKQLWNTANRRLVISNELGIEYQRLFGNKDMELITDGVRLNEVSKPKQLDNTKPIIIYFAGLLHFDYFPLFQTLANALDVLCKKEGVAITMVLRGTKNVPFLNSRNFNVEYRSNFISDEEIKAELDEADVLYLPIKFSLPAFYLYSLSTKMISYLGAAGSILYHGPEDSAACQLLKKNEAAICAVSLEANELLNSLREIIFKKNEVSNNAKKVAQQQFNLLVIQNRFWQLSKFDG